MSPVQVSVLPVRDDHEEYATEVAGALRGAGLRVEVLPADEPLNGRVRKAKLEKIPYVLVVGDEDVASRTVGVNSRDKERPDRGVPLDQFLSSVVAEVEAHGLAPAST
jgi:threonyl-tRNA synthetase